MSGEKAAPLIKRYVIQVNPGRPRLGIDLTLTPMKWLPDACNGRAVFTARIYALNGGKWVYPGEKRKITFSFKEVSKERGVCMNYPTKDASNTNPDLFFPDDDSMKEFDLDEDETDGDAEKKCPTEILKAKDNPAHKHHYLKATTKKPVTEATVTVRCEDYGAFGVLRAIAPDCETIPPRGNDADPSEGIGPNDVKIPRDDNDNDIADRAPQDKYKLLFVRWTAPADADEDDTPHADDHKGDGLTNYEEYRGFIVGKKLSDKKHIRTNINIKDVFIFDRDNLGIGFFKESGLIIHFLPGPDYYNGDSKDRDENELKQGDVLDPGTQVINFNLTKHSSQEQHGIRLVNEYCNGGEGITWGVLHPAHPVGAPRFPKDTNRVAIDRAACNNAKAANTLPATIAHELGHSVGLLHHGEDVYVDVDGERKKQVHEHLIDDFKRTVPYEYTTDYIGGVTSGDIHCVMRYDNYRELWCHLPGNRNRPPHTDPPTSGVGGHCVHFYYPWPEATGNTFCDSQDGTGCNESRAQLIARKGPLQKFARADCAISNDAAAGRGNCKGRIRVKD